jgi:cysteine desulfurase / selenocysteine lyase
MDRRQTPRGPLVGCARLGYTFQTKMYGKSGGGAMKSDFPILQQQVNGHPLVYLDNAATTQKPRQVIDALVQFYERDNANIHRGVHTLAERSTAAYEGVRPKVARFIGAPGGSEIIFTRNATEGLNLLAQAWGGANLAEGDEIILSVMEHHSNIVPWQLAARRANAGLRYANITPEGRLDLDHLRSLVTPRTKVISVTHASNVLGTINPIAEIAEMARSVGALFVVDGAQSAPHMPVDVTALGCDAYVFSSHKMLGPTGVGVLWAKRELLEAMPPYMGGGDMISIVKPDDSTWADLPHKFEAGTPNIADVVAFGAAIDYLGAIGMDAVRDHELDITAYAYDRMREADGITLFGPPPGDDKGAVLSFALDYAHPHDIATILDTKGIAVRAGHHCAQILMRELGQPATARASFYIYNDRADVDALIDGLGEVSRVMGGGRDAVAG